MAQKQLSVTVADLIDAGLIKAPARATADYSGQMLQAEITADGKFEVNGKTYKSPSTAAGYAIATALNRRTVGRRNLSVNGWNLWKVVDVSGQRRSLLQIRADVVRESGKKR